MRSLGLHGSAFRLVPIGVFISPRRWICGIYFVKNVILELRLNGVIGENRRVHVTMHRFGLARLNGHFQEPDVVVFEKHVVDLWSRGDRF